MWVVNVRTKIIAQVINPEDFPTCYSWCRWNDDTVYVYKGFRFPDEMKGEPGTDCFVKVKRKRFWKGLKVRWDDNVERFFTV